MRCYVFLSDESMLTQLVSEEPLRLNLTFNPSMHTNMYHNSQCRLAITNSQNFEVLAYSYIASYVNFKWHKMKIFVIIFLLAHTNFCRFRFCFVLHSGLRILCITQAVSDQEIQV